MEEFDVELKNEKLETLLQSLDHSLNVGCCPAAAQFVFQYAWTFEADVLKYHSITYFDRTNVNLTESFCFRG